MIMIVKTPGSHMGSPAAAEEGGEVMGGGRGETGESSEVHERQSVTSTAPKARSRSRGVATLDESPWMLLRMSSKLPSLALMLLFSSSQSSHQHQYAHLQFRWTKVFATIKDF